MATNSARGVRTRALRAYCFRQAPALPNKKTMDNLPDDWVAAWSRADIAIESFETKPKPTTSVLLSFKDNSNKKAQLTFKSTTTDSWQILHNKKKICNRKKTLKFAIARVFEQHARKRVGSKKKDTQRKTQRNQKKKQQNDDVQQQHGQSNWIFSSTHSSNVESDDDFDDDRNTMDAFLDNFLMPFQGPACSLSSSCACLGCRAIRSDLTRGGGDASLLAGASQQA